MEDPVGTPSGSSDQAARFGLAPPRRFVLPAILLVVSERPAHGYSLQKALEEFRLGHIDRPSVYRALAQLETDGLVESWAEAPKAGQARRVYGITALGGRVLGIWMRVIKDERDCLGRVLRRYQATGTTDAVLAEVEGGWASALGFGWSPVSSSPPSASPPSSSARPRRLAPIEGLTRPAVGAGLSALPMTSQATAADPTAANPTPPGDASRSRHGQASGPDRADPHEPSGTGGRHFRLVPDRSVVLIEVRSTVGPISFGALGVTGTIVADLLDGALRPGTQPSAHIEIRVEGLRSGNGVYDAELLRRIGARRFPVATIDLRSCIPGGSGNHYRLTGDLTFHGVTRPAQGSVTIEVEESEQLVVTGEQVFDIRDFEIPSPTVLMLRIYPDVRVRLHVEAHLEDG